MRPLMLAAAVVAAACGRSEPVRSTPLEAEVDARFKAWVRALNWASPDSLTDFYVHADYLSVAWPNGERTRGWERESEFQRTFLPTVETLNLVPHSPVVVLVRRNLALISFPFNLDLAAGGVRQIGPGQGMMLWRKEGGRWRISGAQLSYTKSLEGALPSAARRR